MQHWKKKKKKKKEKKKKNNIEVTVLLFSQMV